MPVPLAGRNFGNGLKDCSAGPATAPQAGNLSTSAQSYILPKPCRRSVLAAPWNPKRGAATKPFKDEQNHQKQRYGGKKFKKKNQLKLLKKPFLFVVNNYLMSGLIHKFNKIRLC